jgi:adenine-specific DNA glycosylase
MEHCPPHPQELSKIQGIGPYTAAAIASIAFDVCVPVVDGNVVFSLTGTGPLIVAKC